MNMDMKKKIFWSVIITIAVLIVILLIAIIALNSRKETRVYNGTIANKNNTTSEDEPDTPTENVVDNTIVDERDDITGEITYEKTSDGGAIPVPPTFKYVEGDSQTGAVIEDTAGNQFVWVPVDDYNSYHRQYFSFHASWHKLQLFPSLP